MRSRCAAAAHHGDSNPSSEARALVALLALAGFEFVERWSDRLPGKLCAEDGVQIAVVPFRDSDKDDGA